MTIKVSGASRNIGFSGDNLNVSGLSEGRYLIETWYDQTGNNWHITAGSSRVPMLYVRPGHMPCVLFMENDFMNLPGGLTVDRANSAVFHAARYTWQNRAVDCINWGTSSTSALRFGSFIDGGRTPAMQVVAGGVTFYPSTTQYLSTCTPCLTAYNVRSSSLKIRRDGYVQTVGSVSAGTFSGGRIGASGNPTSYGRQDMFGMVIYGSGLTDADERTIATAMTSIFSLNSWSPSRYIMMAGDSKTQGDAAVNNLNLPRRLHDQYGNDRRVWIRNFGNNGSDIGSRYATFWFRYGAPYNYVEPDAPQNVVVCWLGINDVAFNRTAAQILADYTSFFNVPSTQGSSLTAQGWDGRVIATIMPARNLSTAQNAVRTAVNVAIPALPGINRVWDVNALCNAGGVLSGFTTDTSLAADGLHESEKAYGLEAPSLKAAIDASV